MEEQWSYEKKKDECFRPIYGILIFVVVMVSFYTIIAWAQRKWGMFGLALTEAYLLLLSVLGARLLRAPLGVVFPIKKPKWKNIFAVFLFWVSAYAAVVPLTMTVAYFFPEQMFSVSGELNDFMASVPFLVSVLVTCLMPAVCEEALHRGFILKNFQSRCHNKWVLSIVMGIFFGLFHGNIWRFLPTAILGVVLTYLMLETENMIYPALLHFINNFLPSFLAGLSPENAQTQAAQEILVNKGLPLAFLGIYFCMACIVPFGFYTAGFLLRRGEAGREQSYIKTDKTLVLLVVFTVLPVILGVFLIIYGWVGKKM